MALFTSDTKDALKKLAAKQYESTEDRDALLAKVAAADGLTAKDIVWMLFRPDRALRDWGAAWLRRQNSPDLLDAFLVESKGKPDQAFRAAAASINAMRIPGIENRLLQLVSTTAPNKDFAEIQEIGRRLATELTPTPALAPVLWQMLTNSTPEERPQYLSRLATLDFDDKSIARWQNIVKTEEGAVRDKALEVLAERAPLSSLDLFLQHLPNAGYTVQQKLADALSKAAESKPSEVTARLLPFVAADNPATRSAVLSILARTPDREAVARQYILFSRGLAGFVRDRALDALRTFGDAFIEPVISLLDDEDEDVRAAAVQVASLIGDPRAVPGTIRLLKDPDWWVRIAAADMLGHMKDARAVEPLVASLADPEVKWAAIEALGRIGDPRALNALGKMLADPLPDVRIEVMMALPHFSHPSIPQILTKIAATDPDRNVRQKAIDILDQMHASGAANVNDLAAVRSAALAARSTAGEPKLNTLLIATRNQSGSDFHLSVGQPPIVRLASDLLRVQSPPFTPEDTEAMIREILTEKQWATLQQNYQLDFSYTVPNAGRYRANVFYDHRGYHGVFRVIPERPPTITELGLPPQLAEIADYHQGIVMICGPSGSGKSTTLAALVNLFNETRNDHVITLEDPIEFVHPFKNCLINQREVGGHTQSYARALRAALREDPDVIVIGELRDNESVGLALMAAETGHIVLGTLNSTSAPKAIDRIISSFAVDEQSQIRSSMSESLKYIIAQRLLPAREGRKQVAAYEVLKGTTSIGSMIRDEKTFQIYSQMQIGKSQGMITFDDALKDLLRRNEITPETAYLAALKKEDFESLVSAEFIGSAFR
ncbi:MAG TPA: PilT/PilU family type 4a pilus ATPase [Thermoanaerobaculia bacterium]